MQDTDFEYEYAVSDRKRRLYQQELMRHSDPRDPDYPGDCEYGSNEESSQSDDN